VKEHRLPHIYNRVLLLLGIAGGLALAFAGFLDMAPNRLARGVDLPVFSQSLGAGLAVAVPLAAFILLAFTAKPSEESRSSELDNPSSFETPHFKSRKRDLKHQDANFGQARNWLRLLRMRGLKTWPTLALILRSLRSKRLEGRGPFISLLSIATLVCAALLLYACLVDAGLLAKSLASPETPALRLSLGPAFWIPLACALFAFLDAMQRMQFGLLWRASFFLLLCLPFTFLAAAGLFDALSLAKEFENHQAVFVQALFDHLVLVVLSLAIALLIAIPIIFAIRQKSGLQNLVYASLGVIQAVPSIALFGLLIAPLSALVLHVPVLAQFGISGTGRTPAIIALVLYALLPLVRNGMTGLDAVSPEVRDAAKGLGFSAGARVLKVDLPLALPALLSGMRVVTVQAIGLATVAALIGAGGLGTFVFQGIGQYALDLVLVGAIPIILLALGADLGFQLLLSAARTRA
jgi:osmoprotectant transport system permease protein